MSESFDRCCNSTSLSIRVPAIACHRESRTGQLESTAPKLTDMESKVKKTSLPCGMKHLADVKVDLDNEALWKVFHNENHEMKVTNTGRPLFPKLILKVSGLLPSDKYSLTVNFANVDSTRYRHSVTKNEWFPWSTNITDPTENVGRRLYEHPASPASGAFWTTGSVSFDKLRLTTDLERNGKHMIQVSSLRKYRIQVIVAKLECSQCHQPHLRMIELPLTEFITVTGYRNYKITQLKIEKNPASTAFREDYKTRRTSRKRKRDQQSTKRVCKTVKVDDVISTPVIARSFSLEEQSPDTLKSSCRYCPVSMTTFTPSIDLNDQQHQDEFLCAYNDEFQQPPCSYESYQPASRLPDIPQFQIPDISTQYPNLFHPAFQPQEQCAYECNYDKFSQSFSYKYEDFTSPFQYTEWDTLYY